MAWVPGLRRGPPRVPWGLKAKLCHCRERDRQNDRCEVTSRTNGKKTPTGHSVRAATREGISWCRQSQAGPRWERPPAHQVAIVAESGEPRNCNRTA